MPEYPYNYPLILTDQLFLLYGGMTGTSSSAQRQIAFSQAEEQMTEFLNSFLLPTTVTGTFWANSNSSPVRLDYGRIIQVKRVTISSIDGRNSCEVDTVTGCHAVRGDGTYGFIDVAYLTNCGGCGGITGLPYNIHVAYESGLQSGTTFQPRLLGALVLAAQINLNEIDVSLSNEGTADIGISEFSNHKYSEKRVTLGNTVFGNSPTANRVARMARVYRTKPSIGFH